MDLALGRPVFRVRALKIIPGGIDKRHGPDHETFGASLPYKALPAAAAYVPVVPHNEGERDGSEFSCARLCRRCGLPILSTLLSRRRRHARLS
jgi:hypothetical protein